MHGWAYVNEQQRPIVSVRQIKKGRHRGKVEVTLGNNSKKVVPAEHVRRYPMEEE